VDSKRKGSEFERRVVRLIQSVLGLGPEQVYRTPMSGAHFALGRGVDVQIQGQPALALFPFAVECKHVRTWRPDVMAATPLRTQEAKWIAQVEEASSRCGLAPLLVMMGHGTDIWAATREPCRPAHGSGLRPRIHFHHQGQDWVMARFLDVLEAINASYISSGGRPE